MAVEGKLNYNDFVSKLNNSGVQTSWLAQGETNFEEYGTALSGDLKREIMDSFDNEQDYKLQEQIASMYKNNSVLQSEDFIKNCESMGLKVNVEYRSTSYIIDEKFDGQKHGVTNGSIAFYTISDGHGGEIKIADANGNGALESEELFMNQILGDIAHDIGNIANGTSSIQNSNQVQSMDSSGVKEKAKKEAEEKVKKEEEERIAKEQAEKEAKEKAEKEAKEKVEKEYNEKYTKATNYIQKEVNNGKSESYAKSSAKLKFGVYVTEHIKPIEKEKV